MNPQIMFRNAASCVLLSAFVASTIMLSSVKAGKINMEVSDDSTAVAKVDSTKDRQIFCTTDVNRDRLLRSRLRSREMVRRKISKGLRRRKRYNISRQSNGQLLTWDSDTITWALTMPSRQLETGRQRRFIQEAMAQWSAVTPLNFVEVTSSPDVEIKFARLQHGPQWDPVFDGRAKPGRPNSLGHAWGPGTNRKNQNGDVHFDEGDDWTSEIRFMGVTVHELGHSLGLMHSSDPNAIMFPAYRDTSELGDDDIEGIQLLYGPGAGTPRPRQTPTPRTRGPAYGRTTPVTNRVTLSPDNFCLRNSVDAIVEDPFSPVYGYYYVLMDDTVHHILGDGSILSSFHYNLMFPTLDTRPDVLISLREKESLYVIKDFQMWEVKVDRLVNSTPISLREYGFPERPIFSLALSDIEGKRKIYLFGRRFWWYFDVDKPSRVRSHEISQFSRDYPRDVIFTAQWDDNSVYAVTENSYVKLDLLKRSRTHDEPLLPGKPEWFNKFCLNSSQRLQMTYSILLISMALVVRRLL